ncbi:hypothetical protein GCM10020358_19110 [Amorphoplanes nipponensis]|uniref:Uncharacterized protein n=1 Tax=Actinoplanes nipponensis TaxID=135950 RepID=A0A919JJF4_9ACTN|nr:hypothetical protein Ani05nite_39740 [Actinoplanes nipponensis]
MSFDLHACEVSCRVRTEVARPFVVTRLHPEARRGAPENVWFPRSMPEFGVPARSAAGLGVTDRGARVSGPADGNHPRRRDAKSRAANVTFFSGFARI